MSPSLGELDWPRRTERLTLRPAVLEDAAAVYAFEGDPEVTRWTTRAYPTREEFEQTWPDRHRRALAVEEDGRVIGTLMIRVEDAWGQSEVAERTRGAQAELGWTVAPWAQGRGVATEAVHAALAIAFEGLGVRRVYAQCFADNIGSWTVMRKVGLRLEARHVKESLHRSGEWLDGMVWALLEEEWRMRPLSGGSATPPTGR